MSGQHCENYDVKQETVHCYPRNVDRCCTSFVNNVIICFHRFDPFALLYNKSLNDWSLGEQWILFPSNLNVSLDFVSGNIEILGKQNSLFPKGPVMKCLLINGCLSFTKLLTLRSSPRLYSLPSPLPYLHKWFTKLFKIADDTQIFTSSFDISALANNLNSDLKNLSDWLTVNKLQFHPLKTKLMVIWILNLEIYLM